MVGGHLLGDSACIPFIDEGDPHRIARDFLDLLSEFIDLLAFLLTAAPSWW